MLHRILEQNQVHDSIELIVRVETLSEPLRHSFGIREHVVQLVIQATDEVGEHQDFRRILVKELLQIELREALGADITGELAIFGQVRVRNESVTIDTLSLVHPKFDQFLRLGDSFDLGVKQTLEHVGQVTHVEFVMEVRRSLTEVASDLGVQVQSRLDDDLNLLVDRSLEFAEVLSKIGAIDLRQ